MIACIDIGGTSLKVAIANNDELLEKGKLPVRENFELFVEEIVNWVLKMKEKYDIEGLAFSAPGAVDTSTGIIGGASAIPYIHGPNFKEIFSNRLNVKVSIENDANCAALAEIYSGAAKGYQDVCFVVCGSGIGGAVIKDGLVHHGKHLHGGEFGYTIVCEENGDMPILSEVASTRSMVRYVADQLEGEWNGEKVFVEAENGNQICMGAIERFYHYLALGIYNIQYTYDPELIVIGGAISQREDLCDNISRHLDMILKEVGIAHIKPEVVSCKYSGDANLIGALVNYRQEV
ncbi:MAG: ROK family protein [Erysipelotrichaceae bacterium]|nr:ROK family protein [Erysipelotrichaceae bacterium]